jgi:gliding motility-associated-like protein
MKSLYKVALGLIISTLNVNAQGLCPYLGPDQYLPCGITSTTLTADFSNCPSGSGGPAPSATTSYLVENIPFAPAPVGGTSVSLSDDSQAGPFNIGFTFCFFGNSYTQFWIGSNGWISFSAGQPNTFTSAAIPSTAGTVPKNCIMGPWQDWHPGIGGQIRYQTIGTAPCRRLVVTWSNVPMYSCTSLQGTFQIIIYESTNVIENHITNKPNCLTWAGGTAVQGIHNQAGTVAFTVPGRNSTQWTTTNNAWRWTPNGAAVTGTLTWYQVGNPTPIGTGNSITVTPPPGGASYTCQMVYPSCYAGYAQCIGSGGGGGGSYPDTVFVQPGPPNIYPTIAGPFDFCPNTSITVTTTQPYASYLWSDGSTLPYYTTTTPGPISVFVTDNNGCTGTATATLNQYPAPVIQSSPVDPYVCPGESVQITASGAQDYTWVPNTFLNAPSGSQVLCTPSYDITYTVIGTDANGCVDSTYQNVYLYTPPTVTATSADPGVCPGFSTQLQASGANTYSWSPATGLSATNISNPTATLNSSQTWQIIGTDINGCSDTTSLTVVIYPLPQPAFSAPVLNGCSPVSFTLQNNSTISSGSIVSYTWTVEGQGSFAATNPSFIITSPGSYDVQLTATSDMGCVQSISTADYLQVYSVPTAGFIATPEVANLGNALITFTNTSTPDAIYFDWDMAGLFNTQAPNSTYEFSYADTFLITLVATTQYGCSDTAIGTVIVEDISDVWIANSFTPNGDGLNETWFPIGRNLTSKVTSIEVKVFNRWGKLVFESNDPEKPWTGDYLNDKTRCPQGVYTYSIKFVNEKSKEFEYRGHVNLIY